MCYKKIHYRCNSSEQSRILCLGTKKERGTGGRLSANIADNLFILGDSKLFQSYFLPLHLESWSFQDKK